MKFKYCCADSSYQCICYLWRKCVQSLLRNLEQSLILSESQCPHLLKGGSCSRFPYRKGVIVRTKYPNLTLALLSYFACPIFSKHILISKEKNTQSAMISGVHREVSTVGDDMKNQVPPNSGGLFQTLKLNTT